MALSYDDFLRSKVRLAQADGVSLQVEQVNPALKAHQRVMVEWLVQGGRRALFASFGLGKSVVQLETVRFILQETGGRGLIVCPLGVRQEFIRDAKDVLGWGTLPRFIRSIEEAAVPGIYLTNYETIRDGKLDPREFQVASLDEASILRGFGGSKTFREFMRLFTGDDGPKAGNGQRTRGTGTVPYRFVATATPSPNEYIELLAYADFLGIMDVSQAKTRFFKRDSTKADKLTLHPHKEQEFWLWVSSWALFVQRPSDLGCSDEGYELPALDVRWHEVPTDHRGAGVEKSGQHKMFRDAAIGVQDAAAEKRTSLTTRVNKVIEILNDFCRKESISESVLPEEQGSPLGSPEGKKRAELSGEERGLQSPEPPLAPGEPGADEGASRRVPPKESREDGRNIAPLVSGQQDARSRLNAGAKAQAVRPGRDELPGDARSSKRGMRHLPDQSSAERQEEYVCGSLPRNRTNEGTALPEVQRRPRDVRGQSRLVEKSGGVSDQVVVWCDLNDEQEALEKAFRRSGVSFSSLTGSDDLAAREEKMDEWRGGKTCAFLSKPVMYGAGVNLQQCHRMIFAGIGFKFCDMIQAIHRIHRFLQAHPCTVHLIYTEAEREVRKQLERKWRQHNQMVNKMSEIIRQFGLNHQKMAQALTRNMGVQRVEASGKRFRLVNWDSVRETQQMPADSVGLVLTSIPFSTQYEYSPNYADFGHSDGNAEFFEQMDYLTPELLRVLQPGRIAAIHVKDRVVPGGMTGLGYQTVYPFHARCIEHYTKHGFGYLGMKTIVTDVVRENSQTYRLGWTEQCKDGSKMGVGMPEYLLLFRKTPTGTENSYADVPVVKEKKRYTRSRWQVDAHGFTRSAGDRLLTPKELLALPHDAIFKLFREYSLEKVYDFEEHVRIGESLEVMGKLPTDFMLLQPQSWHPDVWTDITRMLTLNGAQSAKGKEMHLCPMQFDLADRVIEQMSMPGEVVYDPFAGLGTVPQRAILKGRIGWGCELATGYWADSVAYCHAAESEMEMPSLFDLDGLEVAVKVDETAGAPKKEMA